VNARIPLRTVLVTTTLRQLTGMYECVNWLVYCDDQISLLVYLVYITVLAIHAGVSFRIGCTTRSEHALWLMTERIDKRW
jgi:hypothetical protein